ncbi:hypothetical protein RHSIM_Rhsim09G0074700 [Rhododendron simsii]|uniref:Uncharacterized protein n=1 Tax=Rhododendron simsii TaxID=118357 RepID=A0A834GEC8_RHOSS|nr:hypothetical protein RHSIM_Rhsim09G0074700 [Rhododendron simsii]
MLTLTSPSNNRKRSSSGGRGGRATSNGGGGGGGASSTSSYQLLPLVIVDPSRFDTLREWGRGGWPLPLKQLTEGLRSTKRSADYEIYKLFTNVMSIFPPKEDDLFRIFNKQVEEDRRIVISRSNLNELNKVLEEHDLYCMDLLHVNTDGVVLTKKSKNLILLNFNLKGHLLERRNDNGVSKEACRATSCIVRSKNSSSGKLNL